MCWLLGMATSWLRLCQIAILMETPKELGYLGWMSPTPDLVHRIKTADYLSDLHLSGLFTLMVPWYLFGKKEVSLSNRVGYVGVSFGSKENQIWFVCKCRLHSGGSDTVGNRGG